MRLLGHEVCWSATDLTTAATCEYSLLRQLDHQLGRAVARSAQPDPLLEHIARLGERHEAELLQAYRRRGAAIVAVPRPGAGASAEELRAMHATTVEALRGTADVVYQAGFCDGEFLGFADFLERSDAGWVVADAKLARQARPTALLQLAAYADQVARAAADLAPAARLLLGDGRADDFPLSDVLPVFRERRARLRHLLAEHVASDGPVEWGDDRYLACGRCGDCEEAVRATGDLLLVAGMRRSQRKVLREAGVRTLRELARTGEAPAGLPSATFARLRSQARLQQRQMADEAAGVLRVHHELVDGGVALRRLPNPSSGDIFFDFEGDPLFQDPDDPKVWGLEYLWGVVEAPRPGDESPHFTRWWAHDRTAEKRAFIEFMEYVAQRRSAHPDLHIYHYAPYETTALKRLAGRYATHQSQLDDLLRAGVFVDLYAVVRAAVRVSQPSYSIKKLEPFTMAESDRDGMDVTAGDASIVEYHDARALRAQGRDEEADARLAALEAYNRYDCISTWRLRDWLRGVAEEHGLTSVVAAVGAAGDGAAGDGVAGEGSPEADDTVLRLRARSGPEARLRRSADEQAYALLASAIGYHRRESLPFWWEHFHRLSTPDVHDWTPDRDVFRVSSHEVLEDWHRPKGKQALHRRLLLRGAWGAGSTPGSRASVIYREPCPEGSRIPENCGYGSFGERDIEVSGESDDEVVLVERLPRAGEPHDAVPVALTPASPPPDGALRAAIREVAERAAAAGDLPAHPALDILRRLPPRLATLPALPHSGDAVDDLTEALLDVDSSYVPVQGPPGTGKTHTGSRVIKRLVEEHGWRVGVVAQSHAVVENMLSAVCQAGLDPARVGKKDTKGAGAPWRELDGKKGATPARFLQDHEGGGCALGGTAWTFTGERSVERGSLDLLVIDEAGQFSLANTVAVSVAARRLLLLGDPQQLAQVSQGTHDEPVDESALGWLMGDAETLPRHLGYFLATTYRMHPDLCAKVSTLSYAGELESHPCTRKRHLDGVAPGLRTLLVDGAAGNAVTSVEEAEAVVAQVRELLGASWHDPACTPDTRPLAEEDILVVAPYNAQRQLIRNRLQQAGYGAVAVGTVDKFQGQQAPVVIVSMTASSAAEVPRGMGFLLARNRVNVAISRAQWLAVLVRSRALTTYLPSSAEGLLELGAFIGLSEDEPGC